MERQFDSVKIGLLEVFTKVFYYDRDFTSYFKLKKLKQKCNTST